MQPFWKWLPATWAAELAPIGLSLYSGCFGSAQALSWQSFEWKGIKFPNRLGIAGGVDKNGEHILDWQRMGAGFIEIGTVTPEPQNANPGKILDRNWGKRTLWNKMGFPSLGIEETYYNILHSKAERQVPLLINIGKNRATPNADANMDYKISAEKFAPEAQILVVNVSSPNTTGLRDLQSEVELKKIISEVVLVAGSTPVLVKLSPDQSEAQLQASIDASLSAGAQGFVLTNTTVSRINFAEFPKEGGLSGQAVAELSKLTLRQTVKHLGSRRQGLLIVAAGGVLNAQDVKERLSLGADLVQVYSALVFEGPGFFRKISQELQS